jgi:hypothetical protein
MGFLNMKGESKQEQYELIIPLDASTREDFKPEQPIKVAIQTRDGSVNNQTVKLSKSGKGTANFVFKEKPGKLNVAVGPESASNEELFGMQTIGLNVSVRQWTDQPVLKLPPIKISPYYWYWWLRWCRTFTIRGKVLCPDGNPVPGAEVCAFDTDYWWWWSSKQLVGCATTDVTGSFEIKFRWCCGWWPWWWWRYRIWQLEPILADRILKIIKQELKPRKIPIPGPIPDPTIFVELLEGVDMLGPQPEPPDMPATSVTAAKAIIQRTQSQQRSILEPTLLDELRLKLKDQLPAIPDLDALKLWPWYPWYPWWDCTPDITFQVKQNCLGEENVIVDENVWNTRWNIPTTLNVTLVAKDACCIEQPEEIEGDCMVITHACDDPVQYIGGNPTAPLTPAGYKNPGVVAKYGDRPYAGVVPISGLFGDLASVDCYEFEWYNDATSTWDPMPPAAAGGFTRVFWGPALGVGSVGFHSVPFHFTNVSGRRVIESREHFEASNDPASWGITRFWTSNRYMLMRWITTNIFDDKTYKLRVRSWNLDAGGNLINPRVLPLCNTANDNGIILTIDNRFVTSGPTCPNGHVCGSGTVHTCTAQPDTDFIAVKIIHADSTETNVGACGNVPINDTDLLQIDFMAHDPDGHLSYYTLVATYGENLVRNLLAPSILSHPASSLAPLPVAAPVPPASQVGPNYGDLNPSRSARHQGAVAPVWHGGALRLRVPAKLAFPLTCCYQLELRAYKRTIVNCEENLLVGHRNLSEYSFMIVV